MAGRPGPACTAVPSLQGDGLVSGKGERGHQGTECPRGPHPCRGHRSFPRKPGAGRGLWVFLGVGHPSGPAPRGARALPRHRAMEGGPYTPSMGLGLAPLPHPSPVLRFPPCSARPSTTPFQTAKPGNPGAPLAPQRQTAPVASSSPSPPGSWAHQASEMAQAQPTAPMAAPRSLQCILREATQVCLVPAPTCRPAHLAPRCSLTSSQRWPPTLPPAPRQPQARPRPWCAELIRLPCWRLPHLGALASCSFRGLPGCPGSPPPPQPPPR